MNARWRHRHRELAGHSRRKSGSVSLGTAALTVTAGALLTLATGIAAIIGLEQFGPSVGGIIVFRPDAESTERWSVKAAIVEASPIGLPGEPAGRYCDLTPSVMAVRGGSLLVEARRLSRPPEYRVHWAGGHTDDGAGDCGTGADLMLERAKLMRLANVAGGFSSGMRLIGP